MKNSNPISWTLQFVSLSDLKPHPKNPRQIGKDQFQHLGNLIEKFGLIDKPILNQDLTIIGGHQRIRYLKKTKQKTVECWTPHRLLDEKEVEELMIGVNKIHGQFDYDILANEFDPIELLKWGFSEKELLDTFEEPEEITEEPEEEKKKKKERNCPGCGYPL